MAETDISVAAVIVRAELAEFKKSMATMGPAAAEAAKDMTAAIQKELKAIEAAQRASMKAVAAEHKKAGDEAKKAAQVAGNSWNAMAKGLQSNQAISDVEQIGSIFIQMGGAVSQVASVFTSAFRPVYMLTQFLGPAAPLALGVAALPAALMILKGTLASFADGALEAEKSLKKMGLLTDAKASQTLRSYESATNDLSVAWAELSIVVGEAAAPALTTLAMATAAVVRDFTKFLEGIRPLTDGLQTLARVSLGVVSLGFTELALGAVNSAAAANDLSESYDQLEVSVQKLHDAYIKRIQQDNEYLRITKLLEEEDNRLQDIRDAELVKESELKAAKEARAKAAQAAAKAESELHAEIAAAIQLDQEQLRLIDQHNEAVWLLSEAKVAALDAEAEAYRAWWREKAQHDREEQQQEEDDAEEKKKYISDLVGSMATDTLAATGAIFDAIGQTRERMANEVAAAVAANVAAGVRYTEAEKAEIKDRYDALAKSAHGAFVAQQAANTGQAIMSAALAAVQGATAMTGFGVPLPIAAALSASAASALLGANLAAISTAQPPQFPALEFPTGYTPARTPDHYMAGLQRGEGVASRRAMADPELRQALEEGNEGRRQRRAQERVVISLDRRTGRLRVTSARPGKRDRRR